jgi:predicted RNA-binding protein with RPS1 domain
VSQENDAGRAQDPTFELNRLVELAAKYPEIGPPLAELAFKIGHAEVGERVVRMGLERSGPGVEYYFVAASAARREGRHADALRLTVEAVRAFAAAPDDSVAPDDGARLLHLVRLGFAVLMFDLKDLAAEPAPGFVRGLIEALPTVAPRLDQDPFYHALLAQALWFEDRERSEKQWDRAAELGEPDLTWNARGTWYKEAEHDVDKAERAYRQGLERAPHSALLLHNLAQLLVERAGVADVDVEVARRLLNQADELLRGALREESPKGLRRHVHSTRDRLNALRTSLPPRSRGAPAPPAADEPEPEVGEVFHGRVQSLETYGAFVSLRGRLVGLLHKSEMAHEPVFDPARLLKVGDEVEVKVLDVSRRDGGRLRIALSRRALLPAPASTPGPAHAPAAPGGPAAAPGSADAAAAPPGPAPRGPQQGGGRRRDRDARDGRDRDQQRGPPRDEPAEKFLAKGRVSLGEMILAKLKEQEHKG